MKRGGRAVMDFIPAYLVRSFSWVWETIEIKKLKFGGLLKGL